MCLRILHVVGTTNRGGSETLIMNIYRNIDRTKIQFDFMAHDTRPGDFDEEIRSLGGNIYYVPRYKVKNHFSYVNEWRHFFQSHTEHRIVHGHMRSTASIYLNVAKKHHKITIAHSHSTSSRGNLPDRFAKKILQYPLRSIADYFFACSYPAGIWLFGKKICHSSRFWILKNAIQTERFLFHEELRQRKRKELGIGWCSVRKLP